MGKTFRFTKDESFTSKNKNKSRFKKFKNRRNLRKLKAKLIEPSN